MKLILFGFLFITNLALADRSQIKVQGQCQKDVVPDRGLISFTAENQAKDQETAVKKTHSDINKLKASLESLKLQKVEFKTTGYSVHPVREWEKEKMVNKGHRASLTLQITTQDISRLGEAMKKASEAGITNVGPLETFLSLDKEREEYLKCLDVAAEDARLKAQQLAKKLNFKLGEVIELIESPVKEDLPSPMPMAMMKSLNARESAPAQVEAGTQKFSTTIQVTFKIK